MGVGVGGDWRKGTSTDLRLTRRARPRLVEDNLRDFSGRLVTTLVGVGVSVCRAEGASEACYVGGEFDFVGVGVLPSS